MTDQQIQDREAADLKYRNEQIKVLAKAARESIDTHIQSAVNNGISTDVIHAFMPEPDLIAHPSHYVVNGYECWDIIDALELPYHLGAVMAYIWRSGRKEGNDPTQDLEKADAHLQHQIKLLKSKRT